MVHWQSGNPAESFLLKRKTWTWGWNLVWSVKNLYHTMLFITATHPPVLYFKMRSSRRHFVQLCLTEDDTYSCYPSYPVLVSNERLSYLCVFLKLCSDAWECEALKEASCCWNNVLISIIPLYKLLYSTCFPLRMPWRLFCLLITLIKL